MGAGGGGGRHLLTPGSDWPGQPVLGSQEVGGEGAPTNPRGWSWPGHLWVVERAEEVTCSREGPVTSNHGKDKKGLHPFVCGSTSGTFPGRIWVLCSSVIGCLKMDHEGFWSLGV